MTDNASAGATPAAGGATPPQTPAQPAAATPPAASSSATGDDQQLGDAGKRALEEERRARREAEDRAKAFQKDLDELKAQGLSESEKAVADAKKAGAAEVTERFHGQIRRAETRSALTSAGINASVLDLATKADEFAALKVTDDGEVTGLDAAVDAFKRARPDLFAARSAPRPGDAGLGPRGTPAAGGIDMNTAIRRMAGRA
jgi:hypothetical protein